MGMQSHHYLHYDQPSNSEQTEALCQAPYSCIDPGQLYTNSTGLSSHRGAHRRRYIVRKSLRGQIQIVDFFFNLRVFIKE